MPDPTAAGYDVLAAEYANRLLHELRGKPFDREFLSRFAALAPAGPVLDVGCGPGQVGRFLHESGRAVTGVDISPEMVTQARQLNPEIQFTVGDLRALPFPTQSFAGVVAFYSIIHLSAEELPVAFAELKRVLAPGGRLAVAFHIGQEVRHVEELWGIKTRLDFVFFEPEVVATAIRAAGFRVTEQTSRPPYDAAVEAQTTRCYVLASAE